MPKNVAVIVAHPDDETLWAGGAILSHPSWKPYIICICVASNKERAHRFFDALEIYKAGGNMGDLDDGPEQIPLDENEVKQTILGLLPSKNFDLILTHDPSGEYTRHRRHEEVSKAVIELWYSGDLLTEELWTFAYEDGNRKYHPRPIISASIYLELDPSIMEKKYKLITKTYGFAENSWEALTTPHAEAFRSFTNAHNAKKYLDSGVMES